MPQAMNILDAEVAVNTEWKEVEKLPGWQLNKVMNEKEVILEAQRDKRKVHLVSLMDIGHLKNSELEPKYQKYKSRVVLPGDIVTDDHALLLCSLSNVRLHVKSCNALHVHQIVQDKHPTQYQFILTHEMEHAPTLLKIPKSECPGKCIRPSPHKWPQTLVQH